MIKHTKQASPSGLVRRRAVTKDTARDGISLLFARVRKVRTRKDVDRGKGATMLYR